MIGLYVFWIAGVVVEALLKRVDVSSVRRRAEAADINSYKKTVCRGYM